MEACIATTLRCILSSPRLHALTKALFAYIDQKAINLRLQIAMQSRVRCYRATTKA